MSTHRRMPAARPRSPSFLWEQDAVGAQGPGTGGRGRLLAARVQGEADSHTRGSGYHPPAPSTQPRSPQWGLPQPWIYSGFHSSVFPRTLKLISLQKDNNRVSQTESLEAAGPGHWLFSAQQGCLGPVIVWPQCAYLYRGLS